MRNLYAKPFKKKKIQYIIKSNMSEEQYKLLSSKDQDKFDHILYFVKIQKKVLNEENRLKIIARLAETTRLRKQSSTPLTTEQQEQFQKDNAYQLACAKDTAKRRKRNIEILRRRLIKKAAKAKQMAECEEYKKCSVCNNSKPVLDYYKTRNQCKPCFFKKMKSNNESRHN